MIACIQLQCIPFWQILAWNHMYLKHINKNWYLVVLLLATNVMMWGIHIWAMNSNSILVVGKFPTPLCQTVLGHKTLGYPKELSHFNPLATFHPIHQTSPLVKWRKILNGVRYRKMGVVKWVEMSWNDWLLELRIENPCTVVKEFIKSLCQPVERCCRYQNSINAWFALLWHDNGLL